jgi:hypothetical protein
VSQIETMLQELTTGDGQLSLADELSRSVVNRGYMVGIKSYRSRSVPPLMSHRVAA